MQAQRVERRLHTILVRCPGLERGTANGLVGMYKHEEVSRERLVGRGIYKKVFEEEGKRTATDRRIKKEGEREIVDKYVHINHNREEEVVEGTSGGALGVEIKLDWKRRFEERSQMQRRMD